jgi:hypothetical protein
MKNSSKTLGICFAIVAGMFGETNVAFSQVTLTVSPSIISNSYTGDITLQIGGLTNGETVNVLTYVDLNGNGTVDPGEPLVDEFQITDNGSNGIYGTVTNVNIPIDSNPVGGAISTALNFAPALTLGNIVGQQIFTVVSESGRFAPVTATLVVTNAATTQGISGTVFNGATPLPNAVVVALTVSDQNYQASAVADNSGNYSINLNPGQYMLLATLPNYYTGVSPTVNLTNGIPATANLSLTPGTVTIAGQVYDAATSNGLGGILLQMQSGNLTAIAITDTNGNYSAAVTAGFWKIKPDKERLARRAYVVSQNTFQVDATGGAVSNANIALYKGTALFYGRITDGSGAPLANVEFDADDGNNQFDAKGFSNPAGYYAVAVLGSTNDDWYCSGNSGGGLGNYILNTFENMIVPPQQAVEEDFVALPITASISGRVVDDSGNPVAGVSLYAQQFDGSYQSLNESTDSSGNYSLGVDSGTWEVGFELGGQSGLDTAGFADLFGPYEVTIPPTNADLNITVYPLGAALLSQVSRSSPTQFTLSISGVVNQNYTLQVSTNLASTNWSSLFSFIPTNSPFQVIDRTATNSPRFYRAVKAQ